MGYIDKLMKEKRLHQLKDSSVQANAQLSNSAKGKLDKGRNNKRRKTKQTQATKSESKEK